MAHACPVELTQLQPTRIGPPTRLAELKHMADFTWQFTENPADEQEGPNDAGIMTFTKDPLRNLIRETIQNSLDDGANSGPVKIDYQIQSVPGQPVQCRASQKSPQKRRKFSPQHRRR